MPRRYCYRELLFLSHLCYIASYIDGAISSAIFRCASPLCFASIIYVLMISFEVPPLIQDIAVAPR